MIRGHFIGASLVATLLALGSPAVADDKTDLADLLDSFLANVDAAETHDRFWAEDLVYTSSNGTRFDKSVIMSGFDTPSDEAGSTGYSAEDVDIRLYGDMAVVAFLLVGIEANGEEDRYFNTGTFARRDGRWQAIAWQATRIPDQ